MLNSSQTFRKYLSSCICQRSLDFNRFFSKKINKVFNFYLIFSGLHMKMDSIRESTAAGLSVTVRKTGIILNVLP